MSALFPLALNFVLSHEGGYVNNPADPGGATNFGITQKTLADWRQRPVTDADVRNIDHDEVAVIYYRRYWAPLGGDELRQEPVAATMLDAGVLFGVGVSARYAQMALTEAGFPGIAVDGEIGPKSIEALNKVDVKLYLSIFHNLCMLRIASLAKKTAGGAVFSKGWRYRIDAYLRLIQP